MKLCTRLTRQKSRNEIAKQQGIGWHIADHTECTLGLCGRNVVLNDTGIANRKKEREHEPSPGEVLWGVTDQNIDTIEKIRI
jgi:hypothetical protein